MIKDKTCIFAKCHFFSNVGHVGWKAESLYTYLVINVAKFYYQVG